MASFPLTFTFALGAQQPESGKIWKPTPKPMTASHHIACQDSISSHFNLGGLSKPFRPGRRTRTDWRVCVRSMQLTKLRRFRWTARLAMRGEGDQKGSVIGGPRLGHSLGTGVPRRDGKLSNSSSPKTPQRDLKSTQAHSSVAVVLSVSTQSSHDIQQKSHFTHTHRYIYIYICQGLSKVCPDCAHVHSRAGARPKRLHGKRKTLEWNEMGIMLQKICYNRLEATVLPLSVI